MFENDSATTPEFHSDELKLLCRDTSGCLPEFTLEEEYFNSNKYPSFHLEGSDALKDSRPLSSKPTSGCLIKRAPGSSGTQDLICIESLNEVPQFPSAGLGSELKLADKWDEMEVMSHSTAAPTENYQSIGTDCQQAPAHVSAFEMESLPEAFPQLETEEDSQQTTLSIVDIVSKMSEQNRLDVGQSNDQEVSDKASTLNIPLTSSQNYQLCRLDKVFIANIVYIKKGACIDTDLDQALFVQAVNKELSQIKEKRKDDRLRFIYKKGIRTLLSNSTGYSVNKTPKMEEYSDKFISHYFPKRNSVIENVLNTTFASCKRFKQLFSESQKFKEEFVEIALPQLEKEYNEYRKDTYQKMLKIVGQKVDDSKENCKILEAQFKRVPWSSADIQLSLSMIRSLAL